MNNKKIILDSLTYFSIFILAFVFLKIFDLSQENIEKILFILVPFLFLLVNFENNYRYLIFF